MVRRSTGASIGLGFVWLWKRGRSYAEEHLHFRLVGEPELTLPLLESVVLGLAPAGWRPWTMMGPDPLAVELARLSRELPVVRLPGPFLPGEWAAPSGGSVRLIFEAREWAGPRWFVADSRPPHAWVWLPVASGYDARLLDLGPVPSTGERASLRLSRPTGQPFDPPGLAL